MTRRLALRYTVHVCERRLVREYAFRFLQMTQWPVQELVFYSLRPIVEPARVSNLGDLYTLNGDVALVLGLHFR